MTYRSLAGATLLFGLAALLLGCTQKRTGIGADTQLFVVADSTNWVELESSLRAAFERTIRTPQPEIVFEVRWVPPRSWNRYATRKNIVIAGLLESDGQIDTTVANMLAPQVRSKVEDGSAFFFPKEDQWAEEQLLMILASTTLDQLKSKLVENKGQLYGYFEEKLLRETAKEMYERLEQKDLADKFLEKYGWTLRVQHDYILNIERQQNRFIMLRRSLPQRERWLFVHWLEGVDPSIIDAQWAIGRRNKMTKKFYQGDIINEEYTSSRDVEFNGKRALMLEGLWENVPRVIGGPFRNYTFYDDKTGRIYMIDVAVFFPGGKKEPFLRQLDIMAHTFQTAHDLNKHHGGGNKSVARTNAG